MDQKKIIQMALIAIIAVWISCFSTVACVTMVRKNQPTTVLETSTTVQTTTTTTTAETSTTQKLVVGGNIVVTTVQVDDPEWLVQQEASIYASQLAEDIKNSLTTTEGDASDSGNIPSSKSEIIKAYIDGVNAVKNTKDFSMYKDDKLNLTFDSITGGSLVQAFADSMVEQNQKVPITYNFIDGVDAQTGATPLSAIAPLNTYASIDKGAVLEATATPSSSGGYTVELLIQDEVQTHTTAAPNLSTTVEVIDVAPLLPAGATLNDLSINYTNTKISATFNSDGKITSMTHYLCVDQAKGSGGYGLLNVTMEMHGDFTSNYTFSY